MYVLHICYHSIILWPLNAVLSNSAKLCLLNSSELLIIISVVTKRNMWVNLCHMIDPTSSSDRWIGSVYSRWEGDLPIMTQKVIAAICHGIVSDGNDVCESAWRYCQCLCTWYCDLKIKHGVPENNLLVSFVFLVKNMLVMLLLDIVCILMRRCLLLMFWVRWHIFHSSATLHKYTYNVFLKFCWFCIFLFYLIRAIKCMQCAMCHQLSVSKELNFCVGIWLPNVDKVTRVIVHFWWTFAGK